MGDGRRTTMAVLISVTLVLLAVGFLSSIPPALKATRVDPMEALRQE